MRIRIKHKVLLALLLSVLAALTLTVIKTRNNVIQLEKGVNQKIEDIRQQKDLQIKKDGETIKIKDQKIQELDKALQTKAQKAAESAQLAAEAAKAANKQTAAYVAPQAVSSDNYSLVTKWANHYGIDPAWMHRVVKCESGYRSDAVNGKYWAGGSTPTGIAQFLASTYIANAKRIGLPAQDDRMNPDRSLQVMAWMFSIGQWTQWECR